MLCDIFLDADETLLDYKKAERTALEQAAGKFGAPFGPEFLERYGEINQSLWRAFERGEITRAALGPRRFQELFEEYGMEADPEEANRFYMTALGKGSFLLPGALEICRCLSERYRLSIITNGSTAAQKNRLEASGLRALCTGCFISEEMGVQKPRKEFFQKALSALPGAEKETSLVVGDSLTSDILGGNLAGIRTCWYNPGGAANRHPSARPDYEIRDLNDLPELCGRL